MPDDFTYHLFISYSSGDREWAKKLKADLEARKVKCFLDQDGLRKGEKWEPQLLTSLQKSRHFVVLWSDQAKSSDWVSQELYRFKGDIDPKGDGTVASGRLLYPVNLQGRNATLTAFQASENADLQRAYTDALANPGPPQLGAAAAHAWNDLVTDLSARVTGGAVLSVPCAVLALTQDLLAKSPPEVTDLKVPDLATFLANFGLAQRSQWEARYGTDPFQWQPFGQNTIQSILQDLLNDAVIGINPKLQAIGKPPIRWSWIDIVTPALPDIKPIAAPLQTGPSLLVIDPISLFSYQIYRRYVNLKECFVNPQAAIVLMTPFSVNQQLKFLHDCLTTQGRPNLDNYYDPIPYNPAFATCGINIADKLEIRRLVLMSLGRQVSTDTPAAAKAILGT